jgi:exopolyphosphatase/guanosine-5'-triphosphate,3'-diphosphate pyrophosphatase
MAATEAIRQASNGGALMDRLSEAIGVPVRLLSGDVEAELSFLGARSWMEREGCQVFIDSGGGSTEVVIADGQRLQSKVSIAVGAASLAQRISGDPPRPLGYGLAAVRVGQLIAALPQGKPESAVATGGSAHNLAKLDPRHPRQRRLSLKELDARTKDLMAVPAAVLARRSGEDPRRVRLLAPGGLILAAVLEHYHLDSMLVAPAGLREGIALAYHASPESWWGGGSEPAAAVRPSHAL